MSSSPPGEDSNITTDVDVDNTSRAAAGSPHPITTSQKRQEEESLSQVGTTEGGDENTLEQRRPQKREREENDKAEDEQDSARRRKQETRQRETRAEDEEEEEGEVDEQEREEKEYDDEDEKEEDNDENNTAPPLPNEPVPPPLPNEAPPGDDDGWEPVWDAAAGAYYFYNRYSGVSQWENPRVPAVTKTGEEPEEQEEQSSAAAPVVGGYNPAIHGDYDPTAPYAQIYERQPEGGEGGGAGALNPAEYVASGTFNRFTGRWQATGVHNPEYHNDENKSRRQMHAFFDVDAAANSHDGRSLRAERSAKKLTKKELKMFKEKRREKKEEKRRAWLRD